MSRQPTKAQLLRAMNHIYARLEALEAARHQSGNAWETIGAITFWVEDALGKEVKSLRVGEEGLEKVRSGALAKRRHNEINGI